MNIVGEAGFLLYQKSAIFFFKTQNNLVSQPFVRQLGLVKMGSFYYQKGDKDIKVGLNSSAQEER